MASKIAKGYRPSENEGATYRQTGNEGRDTGIRCQLLNPVDASELSRLLAGRTHCLQEKHDGRRLLVRKQGDEITGINRRGLVVAIPEPIRLAVAAIAYDVLIDGEAVGERISERCPASRRTVPRPWFSTGQEFECLIRPKHRRHPGLDRRHQR